MTSIKPYYPPVFLRTPKPQPVRFGASQRSGLSPVSDQDLWGGPLAEITFRQSSGIYNCYLLAAIDSILHHPKGRQVMNQIAFEKNDSHYQVRFPACEPVKIRQNEVGYTVRTDSLGVQLLEHAYIKLMQSRNKNEQIGYNSPERAIRTMFGTDVEEISFDSDSRTIVTGVHIWQAPDEDTSPDEDIFKDALANYLDRSASGPAGVDIPFATLKRPDSRFIRDHIYSVRMDNTNGNQVTLADPFNTGKETILPFGEFINLFALSAVRIPYKVLNHSASPTGTSSSDHQSVLPLSASTGPKLRKTLSRDAFERAEAQKRRQAELAALRRTQVPKKPEPKLTGWQKLRHQIQNPFQTLKEVFSSSPDQGSTRQYSSYTARRSRSSMIFGK